MSGNVIDLQAERDKRAAARAHQDHQAIERVIAMLIGAGFIGWVIANALRNATPPPPAA